MCAQQLCVLVSPDFLIGHYLSFIFCGLFQLNRSEFDGMEDDLRVLYEGYRAGLYVRVEISDMPCEFIENFNPTEPIILGGMTSTETLIGTLQVE